MSECLMDFSASVTHVEKENHENKLISIHNRHSTLNIVIEVY